MASCMTFLAGSANQPPEPQNTTCRSLPPAPLTPTLSAEIADVLARFLVGLEEAVGLTGGGALAELALDHDQALDALCCIADLPA